MRNLSKVRKGGEIKSIQGWEREKFMKSEEMEEYGLEGWEEREKKKDNKEVYPR